MHYFILDKNLNTVAIASTDNSSTKSFNVLEDKYTEFSNAPSALEISFDFYNEKSLEVKEGAYITFEFEEKNKLLQIKQVEEIHGSESSVVAYAEESSYELLDSVVFPRTYNNQSLKYLLEICLMDTDWIVGETSEINVPTFEFDSYGTALAQVQKLAEETGCILNFHVEFSPQKGVTGKYVDLVEKVNVDEGKRLEFGINIDSAKRIVDRTGICTAVIPIGENETLVTGFDWVNKYDDKTIEKEKASYYLHVNETKRMEINPNSDLHLFYALNVDSTDKSTLCQKAYEYLKNHKEPKYTYEVNAIILKDESYVIGEQVRIIDDELGVSMIAEVEERTVSQTNPDTNEIVLTNYIEKKSNISQEFYNMQSKLQTSVLNNPLITVDPDEPLIKEVGGKETIWIDTSEQNSNGIVILKEYDAEKGEWVTIQETPSDDKVAQDIQTESAGIKSIVSTWVEQRELAILKGTSLPETAIEGQLFINTNTNIMYRWNGTEWIQLTPSISSVSDLQKKSNEILDKMNATILKQETAPTDTNVIWYDTSVNEMKMYINGEWKIVSQTSTEVEEIVDTKTTTKFDNITNNITVINQTLTTQAGQISSKVEQSTYDIDMENLNATIESQSTQISQNAKNIALKADQTSLDTLTGRVSSAEAKLEVQAGEIALKASQTDLNTLTGRMSSAEAKLEVQAGQISSKVEQSDYNVDMSSLNSTISSHKSLIDQNATSISQRVTKEEFEALKIGGSNLLKQSGRWTALPTWWKSNGGGMELDTSVKYCGYNTLKTTVGNGIIGNNGSYFEIDPNKTYTYSAMIKSSGNFTSSTGSTPLYYHCSSDGSSNTAGITIIKYDQQLIANEWKLCYLTFKPNGKYFKPFIYIGSSYSLTLNIAYLQLEEGDKPTGWMMNADDINDMDISLGNRLTTVESKVTDSAIVDTVTTSTTYTNAMNNLQSQITQNNNSVKVNFQNASGINLLRNSTGYDGIKYWTPTGAGSTQILGVSDPTAELFGLNNAFYFNQCTGSKRIYQDVPCKPRTTYTVSFYANKMQETKLDSSGSDNFIISARNSSDTYIAGITIANNVYTKGYQYFTFTVTTGDQYTLRIRLYAEKETNAYVAGLMLVEGNIAREWTPHVEEAYSDEITMNSEGIRVSRLDNGNKVGYTVMSHDEFAGYYDTDSNGTYEKIFYLDGDATMSKRVAVTNDIIMGDLKATMYNSTSNKGWAFIPATASDKRLVEGSDDTE